MIGNKLSNIGVIARLFNKNRGNLDFSLDCFGKPLNDKLTFFTLISLFIFLCVFLNVALFAGDVKLWKNSGAIQAKGNSLSLYNKGDEIFLQGNTEIKRDDFLIKANKSRIFQKDKAIKSFGNVFAKRIFESGNFLEATADRIFYTDTNKLLEMFVVTDLNYFLQEDNQTINLKADFVRLEENLKNRIANIDNLKSFTMPFEEIKSDKTKITGIDFVKAKKLKATGEISAKDFDYVELNNDVFLNRKISNNDEYILEADNVIYDKKNKIAIINDIKNAVYFSGKEKQKYLLFATKIIWHMTDDNTDVAEIFGNPIIFKRQDESYIVKANKAYYYKKDKSVFFYGFADFVSE